MCKRFTQHYTWQRVNEFLSLIGAPLNLRPRYNIAPTTEIDVVQLDGEDRRELVRMRWGLVPGWWSKDLKAVPATFNARAETVAAKTMFRGAFRHRRCIIPASGFYDWTDEKGSKVPHLFTADDVLSATIIVSGASEWMTPYHNRMPVLLTPDLFDAWLKGEAGPEALRPAAEDALRELIVFDRVNRTGYGDDDPTLVEAA